MELVFATTAAGVGCPGLHTHQALLTKELLGVVLSRCVSGAERDVDKAGPTRGSTSLLGPPNTPTVLDKTESLYLSLYPHFLHSRPFTGKRALTFKTELVSNLSEDSGESG